MKILEKQNFVKVEGDVEVQEFGIIFNAKMVHMLSDSLYQNKIEAIVRELSTNGLDSHVEKGNIDVPLEVHSPLYDAPYFSIRDFGTGLSPERVKNVYLFYGGSDRTESNEFTGGMGLGSKTPFCYNTKTFTVDSWYEGVHYCYSAYIGEDGKPNLALMSKVESDEPSGVLVKLPVLRSDAYDFADAIRKVYSVFPVTPKMVGEKVIISKPKYILTSTDNTWKLRVQDHEGCRVIMGNVAYSLSFNDSDITKAQTNVMNSPFDIFVDIGSMSVEMSREGLSYDNRTKVKARYFINKIIADFNARIQEEIDKCPNLWEARKKYAELYDLSDVKVTDGSKMYYKGHKLFESLYNIVSLETLTRPVDDLGHLLTAPLSVLGIRKHSYQSTPKYEKTKINSVNVKQRVRFFWNDLSLGSLVRAAHISVQDDCLVMLFSCNSLDTKRAVIEMLGCDSSYFTNISDIPSPTVRQQGVKRGSLTKVVKFCARKYDTNTVSQYWSNEENVDMNSANAVYVEFNRFRFRNMDGYLANANRLNTILKYMELVGIAIPTIYGIKSANMKGLDKTKVVSFESYVNKALQLKLPTLNIAEIVYYKKLLDKLFGQDYYAAQRGASRMSYDSIQAVAKCCVTDNDFTKFAKRLVVAQTKIKDLELANNLSHLAGMYKISLPKYPDFDKMELDKEEIALYNTYAMLGFVYLADRTPKCCKPIADYIDSIS